ncbi:hypothetical protein ACN6AT_38610 (plasmid) [Streptomyces sp. JL4002]|uniref:Uncharacterized protein n=1 Tax=Streptomyces liliifuscus TaxID=2797636 RepID=A0A7T7L6V6_9ACTN|nr:hypothetical protein [Streptomyces liliifuscus]QQM47530.1 hypothetical protein JEQ17_49145 [Streptomyces liliifuscus]
MNVARLLAALLGTAPPDEPMARLLVLDEEAFTQRVRLPYPADGADTTGDLLRSWTLLETNGPVTAASWRRPAPLHERIDHSHAYAILASPGDRTS